MNCADGCFDNFLLKHNMVTFVQPILPYKEWAYKMYKQGIVLLRELDNIQKR